MSLIRTIYLYTFSLIGLVLIVMASVSIINLGLKTFIFTEADQDFYPRMPAPVSEGEVEPVEVSKTDYQRGQRQRELAQSIAMLLVGIPLYFFHWRTIKRENRK
ncbi:hypothetical protein CL622_06585 [archaeon]|nr:hypothetical protein [archaeon]|tara:strand:- start:324 stop:635 length:312 start_codon:yes stop_codon:yes gene_type:complete